MFNFRIGKQGPRLREGSRIYAIGDVHGCYRQLAELLQAIDKDSGQRDAAKTKIILLGDIIDRGPDSAKICQLLYSLRDYEHLICLKGNHEKAMCDSLNGDVHALHFWLSFGGDATLESWGLDRDMIRAAMTGRGGEIELIAKARQLIPEHILLWLESLPLSHREDDYFFVHAGIRPGVSLDAQDSDDLLWIREPFLSSWKKHEATIVHGHSESDIVAFAGNRIGIDTAAYRTGCLTALGLENEDQWTLSTERIEPLEGARQKIRPAHVSAQSTA